MKTLNVKKYALTLPFNAAFGVLLTAPACAVEAGKPAPNFALPGVHIDATIPIPVQLSEYKGKVIYLDFWASWCGPCKQSFPWMNALQTKYAAQGFKVIAVNLDANTDDWKRFLAAVPANFEIALDPKGAVAKQFGVKGMPTSLVIDQAGTVLVQHAGFNDSTREKTEKLLQTLLGGKQ